MTDFTIPDILKENVSFYLILHHNNKYHQLAIDICNKSSNIWYKLKIYSIMNKNNSVCSFSKSACKGYLPFNELSGIEGIAEFNYHCRLRQKAIDCFTSKKIERKNTLTVHN